jgi:hypothetical protein
MDNTELGQSIGLPTAGPTGWRRQLVRYLLHLWLVYALLRFAADPLDSWIHSFLSLIWPQLRTLGLDQFLMSNLLAFSIIPAFLVAFIINVRIRHRAACYVWIVPVAILAFNLIFHSATIYPTIPLESDVRPALHYWFGGGFNINDRAAYMQEVSRVYYQFKVTAPAYAGISYSIGAWLAIKLRVPKLKCFLTMWVG